MKISFFHPSCVISRNSKELLNEKLDSSDIEELLSGKNLIKVFSLHNFDKSLELQVERL